MAEFLENESDGAQLKQDFYNPMTAKDDDGEFTNETQQAPMVLRLL
jgi:hypothetical protein